MSEPSYMTVTDIATDLKVSRTRAYELIHEIGFHTIGEHNQIRVKRSDYEEFMETRKTGKIKGEAVSPRLAKLIAELNDLLNGGGDAD